MKKAAFIFVLLSLCFYAYAPAQVIGQRAYGAICPFEYTGEIWPTDMGTILAEETQKRIRLHLDFSLMRVDETREVLIEAKIDNAWNADPYKLRDAFHSKNVTLVFTGKIENIYLIRDVDGTAYADVEIKVNVIDVFQATSIFTDTIKYRTKASQYITKETPFDRDVALSILAGGGNRVANRIRAGIERYMNQRNRRPRIY